MLSFEEAVVQRQREIDAAGQARIDAQSTRLKKIAELEERAACDFRHWFIKRYNCEVDRNFTITATMSPREIEPNPGFYITISRMQTNVSFKTFYRFYPESSHSAMTWGDYIERWVIYTVKGVYSTEFKDFLKAYIAVLDFINTKKDQQS